MPNLQWKDISSYSQGDKKRIPKTFSCEAGGLTIKITRHIHYNPIDWVMFCDFLPAKVVSIGTADEAKEAAVKRVQNHLQKLVAAWI